MRYKIPIEILELEQENYHLLLTTVFSDGTSGKWVIDTGASKTVFDKNLSEHISKIEEETEDLHSAGISDEPIKSSMGTLHPFSIHKMKINSTKVAVLDLSHINALYAKFTDIKICGLLGSDFLMKYEAVIDYKRKRIVFTQ
jgi:hypothetical protein